METKMRNKNFALGLITAVLCSQLAYAEGGVGGGGGGAMVCRQSNQITSVELADLWEFDLLEKRKKQKDPNYIPLKIVRSNKDVDLQITDALTRLALIDKKLSDSVKLEIDFAKKRKFWSQKKLAKPPDISNKYLEPGCNIEGLAYYNDDEPKMLEIEREIFESPAAGATDIAALWVHEGFYSHLRRRHSVVKDSSAAREMVGLLFSNAALPLNRPVPSNAVQCISDKGEASYIFEDADGTIKIRLVNRPLLTMRDISIEHELEGQESLKKLVAIAGRDLTESEYQAIKALKLPRAYLGTYQSTFGSTKGVFVYPWETTLQSGSTPRFAIVLGDSFGGVCNSRTP
jgi:hypothetical protein